MNKKLLGAPGIATRASWDRYEGLLALLLGTRTLLGAPGLTTRNKDAKELRKNRAPCDTLRLLTAEPVQAPPAGYDDLPMPVDSTAVQRQVSVSNNLEAT